MAKLTHSISVLTEGVLMMKTTFVGIVKVDPKQVLEDGIRKELVKQVATAAHNILVFNPKSKQSELAGKLNSLAQQIDGFRRSFLYISDYVNLSGLKIWQEEFSRIINYNVERECNAFQKHKIEDYESIYQSKVIPIPKFNPSPANPNSDNFIGRIMDELRKDTDPRGTYYSRRLGTWYDVKSQEEKVSPQLFQLLFKAVGNIGVSGLDRLSCFMLGNFLTTFHAEFFILTEQIKELPPFLDHLIKIEESNEQTIRWFNQTLQKVGKQLLRFVEYLSKIGQLLAIRELFSRELANSAKFESKLLVEALAALNQSLLSEVKAHSKDENKPYPAENNALMYELTGYLEAAGMTSPLKKIYAILDTRKGNVAGFALFVILSQIAKYNYSKSLGLTLKKVGDGVDAGPLILGLSTLLQHVSMEIRRQFLQAVAAQIRGSLRSTKPQKPPELSGEAMNLVWMLRELGLLNIYSRNDLLNVLPSTLLDHFNMLSN